ncbi:ribosomal-protein-alanine N-acetyltransferase [Streptomyces sp. YIM 130001]|uniref:GNAT family N-acetyltransferase n=1 Tax=Streptomyces sp. YIM 130001 TaxID=2259644 RepID=UPI000E64A42B|nr:GNAT family N-acetyltransferase [Streptomyces sp. YIM 130001]RII15837.1 ribosomal-protein-alanine N-acetyltransferase [Streptomyces sp. YIM 130001]
MEIIGGGRLEVQINPGDVGKRVSVRRRYEDGNSTDRFTDTVGVLTSWTGGVLLITRRTGEVVRIEESTLVAGKIVPPAPARRRGPAATFDEMAHVMARAWQPVESERLGDWVLRAAAAPLPAGGPRVGDAPRRGFTRRANSLLPLGDPGLPLDEALTATRAWYASRGLPAYAQLATRSGSPRAGTEGDVQEALVAGFTARGWTREVTAGVLVGALAPVGDVEGVPVDTVRLSRSCDADWLRRYQRAGEPGPHVRQVLGSGPSVWFATIDGEGAVPAAIGRCVVDGRWAGFMAVEVDPGRRRAGLGTAVMAALARRALDEGASAAWLQVEEENAAARALYGGLGFTVHHRYSHFRAPDAAALPPDFTGHARVEPENGLHARVEADGVPGSDDRFRSR